MAPIENIVVPDAINPQNLLGEVIRSNARMAFCLYALICASESGRLLCPNSLTQGAGYVSISLSQHLQIPNCKNDLHWSITEQFILIVGSQHQKCKSNMNRNLRATSCTTPYVGRQRQQQEEIICEGGTEKKKPRRVCCCFVLLLLRTTHYY